MLLRGDPTKQQNLAASPCGPGFRGKDTGYKKGLVQSPFPSEESHRGQACVNYVLAGRPGEATAGSYEER